MSTASQLQSTLLHLTEGDKGILAADESNATIQKRFETIQTACTPETRCAYRELLFTTPQLENYISGVILFEETLYQANQQGKLFPALLEQKGMLAGIKVDIGLIHLPVTSDEKITQGLDGLLERLKNYYQAGARFAKWRAVFSISDSLPSLQAIAANAEALARYAACCQSQGLVPIVEPEILLEGKHSLERCLEVTQLTLHHVFNALFTHRVMLEYIILKPSMVMAGSQNVETKPSIEVIAQATLQTLYRTVPAAVPSINFLSGGQSPEAATAHLNAMNLNKRHPWRLNFSFGRALQDPALKAWQGKSENIRLAQQALYHRAQCNVAAAQGKA